MENIRSKKMDPCVLKHPAAGITKLAPLGGKPRQHINITKHLCMYLLKDKDFP